MIKTSLIIFIVSLFSVALVPGTVSGQDGDDIAVGCYIGDETTYDEVGNLDVFNPSQRAVGLCNAIYKDCYGRCWACWTDSEGNAVCKDAAGRQFYR